MGQREHVRQLEDAIDKAAAECLKGNPTAAYAALAPHASEEVRSNPPDAATPGDKGSATPGMPATPGATPSAAGATGDKSGGDQGGGGRDDREPRRRNRPRRRGLF